MKVMNLKKKIVENQFFKESISKSFNTLYLYKRRLVWKITKMKKKVFTLTQHKIYKQGKQRRMKNLKLLIRN